MTWIADLSHCDYFPIDDCDALVAVGWLDTDRPYTTGVVEAAIYARLIELCVDPFSPIACCGMHECNLCRYEAEAGGAANLFIPGDGRIYVCPSLITHYMNAHGYRPPEEFCDAVLRCPPMRSMDYRKALLTNGGRGLVRHKRGA